ncbi:MAG: glutathione S-transferase family protein [Hyphomonas sp.]|uniref:glutathione S-transferase family protein n=1 Tax=Hyphomonas sp. TaxID=87 RepID=UPI00185784D7|nr:glutathione S-transferase family protein [Hyphomonas sp.]MBU3919674.1 glutathione S-transferase family protein [Alphaproteobacteria bacterium]MBA3067111.1 glutathione S-transferase family protein [Hyphomonas sp.]MBU4063093.1 glutathione S-transferase family protein [Alphaproteobacteria bacterium]MBU4164410.1 glutathione S-transferase family protein [Alphaproteobacteria bacterium]MBU4567957.1 glutathione S-transferase family protein [Alphaproteobacteria bacterium]
MRLYNSVGPNPHVVRMFMAERGISLPLEAVDILKGENREAGYLKTNPAGQSPCLVLDDGSVISEITAICEYLDEKFPGDSLIGKTPEDRAQTRRWTRWCDLNIIEPLANGFRYSEGLPMFQSRMRCLPDAAPGLKAKAQDGLAFLDGQLATRPFVAGDKFTLADVMLFCFLAFGSAVGQPLDPALKNVGRWYAATGARPSAKA